MKLLRIKLVVSCIGGDGLMIIAIIEDDITHANYLKMLILQYVEENIEVDITIFQTGAAFLDNNDYILRYDIIFLDIELGQMNGIEIARKIRCLGYDNTIVITTNFQSNAIDGYTVNAFRYLLKPIQLRDIKDCISYVINKNAGEYFQYTYHGVTARIFFNDIICFESMLHYTEVCMLNKNIRVKMSLKEIKSQCPIYFVQCQRSYIININYVEKYIDNRLLLKNGKIAYVSQRYMGNLQKFIDDKNNFMG